MDQHLDRSKIDSLRKAHESSHEWRVRKMFLERHLDDYPIATLLCLAQTFININFLGCKYSDTLMEKVRELGAGICEKANGHQKSFEKGYTKGSAGRRATDSPPLKMQRMINGVSEATKTKRVNRIVFQNFMLLKAEIRALENGLDALQSLNQAVSRVKMIWELKDANSDGNIVLTVDDVVVIRSRFPDGKSPITKQSSAAATLAAISSGNVEIRDVSGTFELWRGEIGPAACYSDFVTNTLRKAAAVLPQQGSAYARLEKAFQTVSTPLKFIAEQGTGWEERIALNVLNVQLADAVLKKSECTKAREAKKKDELAELVISMISSPSLKLLTTADQFTIGV
ncbi:unnamed protein product [Anisakis simplex]|uniref:XRN2-binding (XTBD) domain-containing protein n=1 Tax=Anisakis simplex TaxID=6269 RepID=A0A0M3JUP5_ANISI|nr:unnamed protein product [Anisakis simplex]